MAQNACRLPETGRGLDHFRKEGAKLIPEPTEPDPYIEEALQALGAQAERQATPHRPSNLPRCPLGPVGEKIERIGKAARARLIVAEAAPG